MAERIAGRPWTMHEDRLLVDAVAIHGEADNWKAVAQCVPGRTNKACRKRWLHSLSPNVKKSAWTPDEDRLLLELYEVHSTKWSIIARHIPGRTDDACSKRYREALDPSLKRDEWSKEEDHKLLDAYSRLLGRWGQVGQELRRSGLACRNRWRLLERKRTSLSFPEPQPVAVSNPSLSLSSDHPSPALTYLSSPWQNSPMADPRQYWEGNLSHFDLGPSASGQHNHVRSLSNVGLLGSVEPSSVSHPELIQHVVNLPPPFHYSSSSLSSALSSPRTLANRYEQSTTASSACYHTGEPCAALVPIASAAATTSAVFDYGTQPIDPALVASQSTQATDYTQGQHHPVYGKNVSQGPNDVVHRSVAPTPSRSPVSAQHVSNYYSPTPRNNEPKVQMMCDRETSPSIITQDSCHHSASQDPSISLLPSGLGSVRDTSGNYYANHQHQGVEQDLRHFVTSSSDSPTISNVHREYYPSPSSSDMCSPISPADAASCQHSQYYSPSDAVSTQPDISSLLRPATVAPEGSGDYYQPQLEQSQPQFHSLQNNAELNARHAPMPVIETPVPHGCFPVTSAQHSVSVTPSTYALPRLACMPSRAIVSAAKRGPPLDASLPNPEDPNPRPVARQRPSVMRKRPDLHAPLRLSSDLQAANDPAIKPYACGHENCWPAGASGSISCYTTSRGLSDHNKSVHPEDAGGDRPYRCGLEGCGKSWKSINGLQYHLQISKAHFQHAIVSTFVTSYIDGLTTSPAEVSAGEGDDKTKKQYSCPHQGCPNRYKQLSGLRYHLAHGHPLDLPVQLDLVPPALSRKLAEKMRKEGSSSRPSDTQGPMALPAPDSSQDHLNVPA